MVETQLYSLEQVATCQLSQHNYDGALKTITHLRLECAMLKGLEPFTTVTWLSRDCHMLVGCVCMYVFQVNVCLELPDLNEDLLQRIEITQLLLLSVLQVRMYSSHKFRLCVCLCVRVCVRACVRACVHVCFLTILCVHVMVYEMLTALPYVLFTSLQSSSCQMSTKRS